MRSDIFPNGMRTTEVLQAKENNGQIYIFQVTQAAIYRMPGQGARLETGRWVKSSLQRFTKHDGGLSYREVDRCIHQNWLNFMIN